ncbi:indolepyruvate ferredoxin oxidoreductase subunit alpha [Gehongia tenuis]|jgi:2-oxoglutarate ferredoxin oxidoreductase subunit delta|uniref:4Fe-4S binding protein n=1 Tax=Gehongia tenuis TaxID=2763655 RepID=A0A926D2U3_9FIRM|nr:4Fe-4S binding protein [Gehongia tenuis]MBC8530322.1 4Fe-4S binding protein [Gehongia tenuis]
MAIRVNREVCKGCGLCIVTCPKKILKLDEDKLNSKGYNPCVCVDNDACISCALCARMCPDCAIVVEK